MNREGNNSQPQKSCVNHNHSHDHQSGSCCQSTPNPSACQTLDDMDFERGIWQAALDDDVQRIVHLTSSQNISPDLTDAYGFTALHYAARNGNLKAARCLVKLGAAINCQTRNNGTTPLHRAILGNKLEMVRYLLESGASPTIKDNDGHSSLDRAKIEGNETITKTVKKFI